MEFPIRINKYLAKSGYATRRSADKLIEDAKVFVNGELATLGQKVEENDVVEIKDHDTTHFKYILYYKPANVMTLASSPDDMDIVKKVKEDYGIDGLFPIGRLDRDTEGLVILTNDGRITQRLQGISSNQEYEVSIDKKVTSSLINQINRGVKIESHIARSATAKVINGNEYAFIISLGEDKKYNVRSICAALGVRINSLKRTKILNFELKRLKSGEFYQLKYKEIKALHKALGLR